MVKVSIIIPIYNVENYLRRCLDSIVNQSLEDIEIILVNDASKDNSLLIMNEYKNQYGHKIIIIDSKTNLRQGGARNLGINAATGEYIGFVDSDDWIETDMYNKLYTKAKLTNSDIVDCDLYSTSGKEILSSEQSNFPDQCGELNLEKKRSLILRPGRLVTKIFKKELFTSYNIKFPENLFYEDNAVSPLVVLFANRLEKINEPLYYYFVNTTSTTKQKNSYHHFDRLQTSKIFVNEFKKRGLYERYKDEVDFRFSELFYINTVNLCLLNFDKPEISYLTTIRGYIQSNMKNYRKNKYFKYVPLKYKIITKINDKNPKILLYLFLVYKKISFKS
jgi:glycosyltransferase involved in cell wall biosynthesis